MRRGIAVVAVCVLAACAGCGDDDGSAGPEGVAEADGSQGAPADGGATGGGCELVSEAEVATSTGAEIIGSLELPTGCQWQAAGDDPLMSYEWQGVPAEAFAANQQLGEESADMEITPISGLGDDAFLRTQATSAGDITAGETWVEVGDSVFFVRSSGLPWSDDMAAAQREIAQLLVERIG